MNGFRYVVFLGLLSISYNSHTQSWQHMDAVQDEVEVIVDQWGLPHIYANNQKDLFFAQGYHAAKDRLFQFEIWRRQSTGTVAEILGESELDRDIGTRLFMFRKDINQEMAHYHDDGIEIINAYVDGVNAYIRAIRKDQDNLPIEFKLLKILPEYWTPEVVISRHQGLLGNIGRELKIARSVALVGEKKVKELIWFHPKDPDISIDESIDTELLFDDILHYYNAYRKPVVFNNEHGALGYESYNDLTGDDFDIGSNNWAVRGDRTESGYPFLANDPHRTVAVPSLRYMAHLVAPGWNVIGGGEPEIPGISIGHNEKGAWGLTVYRTDAEDLYVYKTNPDNSNQYWHNGTWLNFQVISDKIKVKGMEDVKVDYYYSIHGPVTHRDDQNHVAYAVKCGWLEYGGSPYLASLRMDQAETFAEFRAACNYSNIPGENMVWADKEGNIGWQAVGIAPIRTTHSGLVPVPGDGTHEWDGYLPIIERPNSENPEDGMIITANENVTPDDYKHFNTVNYEWSDPYRGNRVREVLAEPKEHSMVDMALLQTDVQSIPSRQLIALLEPLSSPYSEVNEAIQLLTDWDNNLSAESIPASIYHTWESNMRDELYAMMVPEEIKPYISSIQHKRVIEWLIYPDDKFGNHAVQGRDAFLLKSLSNALSELAKKLGKDWSKWQYGQAQMKHSLLTHNMSGVVNDSIRNILNVGPMPRGGDAYSVGSTGYGLKQRSGGTFRVLIDTGDWDRSLATNSPGQSGDPDSKHYRDLFDEWSKDKYFPMFYSRDKVESVKDYSYRLMPD